MTYLWERSRRAQVTHSETQKVIVGLVQRIPELEAPAQEPEQREANDTPLGDASQGAVLAAAPTRPGGKLRRLLEAVMKAGVRQ